MNVSSLEGGGRGRGSVDEGMLTVSCRQMAIFVPTDAP